MEISKAAIAIIIFLLIIFFALFVTFVALWQSKTTDCPTSTSSSGPVNQPAFYLVSNKTGLPGTEDFGIAVAYSAKFKSGLALGRKTGSDKDYTATFFYG